MRKLPRNGADVFRNRRSRNVSSSWQRSRALLRYFTGSLPTVMDSELTVSKSRSALIIRQKINPNKAFLAWPDVQYLLR